MSSENNEEFVPFSPAKAEVLLDPEAFLENAFETGMLIDRGGGTVNLETLDKLMKGAVNREVNRIEEDIKRCKQREKLQMRKKKQRVKEQEKEKRSIEQRLSRGELVFTRARAKNLMEKVGLSDAERRVLTETYGKNRCQRCRKLLDVSAFYKHKNKPRDHCQYWSSCKECLDSDYYTRPEMSVFRQMLCYTRKRCREEGFEYDLTPEDVRDLFELQEGRCNYSGREMLLHSDKPKRDEHGNVKRLWQRTADKVSIDRIDSSKGYTKDNVHLVNTRVNQAKSNMDEAEFLSLVHDISETAKVQGSSTVPPLIDRGEQSKRVRNILRSRRLFR